MTEVSIVQQLHLGSGASVVRLQTSLAELPGKHSHSFHHFLWTESTLQLTRGTPEQKQILTVPGQSLLVWPAQEQGQLDCEGSLHSLSLRIAPERLETVARLVYGSEKVQWTRCWTSDPFVQALLERSLELSNYSQGSYDSFSESIATTLSYHLLLNYASPLAKEGPARSMAPVISYIERSLDLSLSVPELAKKASMATSRFSELFRQSTGLSPHRYVLERRLEKARYLLESSSRSIVEISLACGFSSQSHLSAAFRNSFDETPYGYRRRRQAAFRGGF